VNASAVILRVEQEERRGLFVTVVEGRLQEIRIIGNPDNAKHV
jgi:hypothetical protein